MTENSLLFLRGSFAALALCGASIGTSFGQAPVTNSGTLTCIVADVPNQPSAVIELSCNFKSIAGITSDYLGSAGTKAGTFPTAKHVFVWSVVARDPSKAPLLDGKFTSETGREGPAVLIGGADRSIRLEPAGRNEQLAGPGEITTLTLKLAATKT
jgi:hypothetical protein